MNRIPIEYLLRKSPLKPGRPKLKPGRAKGVLITWRVTPGEADLIRLAMKECGVKKRSQWLRETVIEMAEIMLGINRMDTPPADEKGD